MGMLVNASEQGREPILSGHLRMGGVHPNGEEIGVNSLYLTRGGKPWLPVMGEFHFSRSKSRSWEDELLKMKTGGIGIVATYVFWIYHEETEGVFDWSGDKDLRRFIQLCGKIGLDVFVRIGPWAHGECRNGGFPDWLYGKCALRTDDEDYLHYARLLYGQIAEQLRGLSYQDGGPVVGIQFDNELTENAPHLLTLKQLASEVGITTPLYSVTGWGGPGGAHIPKDEVLPLFGGYPDHPWDKHTEKLPPGPHYFFHSIRNDPGIGSDVIGAGEGAAGDLANIERYPNGTCELGSGVQMTYHRRPEISADDVGAMATVRIANGCNLLGYYMYHGGSHPRGEHSTMQESEPHGNQLPVFSYDFQAPIGEFGFTRESYALLRRLHLFIRDFGEELAPMRTYFPEERPATLKDVETVRVAARAKDESGYLFFNNYQRMTEMVNKDDIQVSLRLPGGELNVPDEGFTLQKDAYFFWPFRMDMDGIQLKYATAQPLCKLLRGGETTYVFFEAGGVAPSFVFEGDTIASIEVRGGRVDRRAGTIVLNDLEPGLACDIHLVSNDGTAVRLILLTEEQSRRAWKGTAFGEERLILCESNILFDGGGLRLYGFEPNQTVFSIYPVVEKPLTSCQVPIADRQDGLFQIFEPLVERIKDIEVTCINAPGYPLSDELFPFLFEETGKVGASPEWEIKLDASMLDEVDDLALTIDYIGDVAQLYIAGRCVADQFYNGQPWKVGLKHFRDELRKGPIVLKISPLKEERNIYMEDRPSGDQPARIISLKAEAEFSLRITVLSV
ncbi:beta-galactosidase [Paenibacillus sp. LHD-117]|uniref:beta-galactosidase n=1 Tax=Paenibacillus sp. LHD-117 TaxID=3071412 RepID=UPI0027E1ABB8|nr:beta-galactosidase [Paenibacillus sp. LHD-117]MDQ6420547.1 beta-galactosidase [Paenibacillus sp. LHD-117]